MQWLNSSRMTRLQHRGTPGSALRWGMASPPGTLTSGLSKRWHRLSSSHDMRFSNDQGNVIKIVFPFFFFFLNKAVVGFPISIY